jgi:hypothetical protein
MIFSKRIFSTIEKPPKFLLKMEHAVSKEKTKEKLTVKITQQNKAPPKGIGKKIKSAGQLPQKSYINFMEAENKVFLGETFSSRT